MLGNLYREKKKYSNFKKRRRRQKSGSLPRVKSIKDLAKNLSEHPEILSYINGEKDDLETHQIETEHLKLGNNDVLIFGDKNFARRIVSIYRPETVMIDGTIKVVPKKMSITHRKTSQLITIGTMIHSDVST